MNISPSFWTCLILFFLLSSKTQAQQRFKAGLIAGFNLSQIDGDNAAGYERFGLVGGVRGVAILSKKSELSLELLYSQRGSQSDLDVSVSPMPFKIKLNYIAVPVLFNYLDWEVEDDDKNKFHKMHFSGGFSYGRLLNADVDDGLPNSDLDIIATFFRQNDVSIVLGATFYANRHLGFTMRWNRSLNLLFKETEDTPNTENNFLSKFLTFHAVYML